MVLRAWRLGVFLQAFHRTQLLLTGRNKNKYQLCWVPHGIYMYVYIIQVSMLYSPFPEHLSLTTQNRTPRIVQSFHPIFDPIFLFLQSDLPPATGHRYRYLPPILPRQLERLFFPFVPI